MDLEKWPTLAFLDRSAGAGRRRRLPWSVEAALVAQRAMMVASRETSTICSPTRQKTDVDRSNVKLFRISATTNAALALSNSPSFLRRFQTFRTINTDYA